MRELASCAKRQMGDDGKSRNAEAKFTAGAERPRDGDCRRCEGGLKADAVLRRIPEISFRDSLPHVS